MGDFIFLRHRHLGKGSMLTYRYKKWVIAKSLVPACFRNNLPEHLSFKLNEISSIVKG